MSIKQNILQGITRRQELYRIQKEQSNLRELLGRENYKGTEAVFNQHTLSWLVVVVTVFLQLISLATTYEGSKMYFGGIYLPLGLGAPLLFALAIQSIVFAMSHIIRRHYKMWLVIILIAATICSTYFSYIGIYNHINPPIDYLEERYEQVYDKLNNQQQLAIDQSTQDMKSYVFDLIGDLGLSYTQLSKEVEENQILEDLINNIELSNESILPQINNITRPNLASYGNNTAAYYEAMRQYNALVAQMVTDSTTQDMQLQQDLQQQTIEAYLGGRSEEAFIKEAIVTESSKEQIEKSINSMASLIITEDLSTLSIDEQLSRIQLYALEFITSGVGDKEIFSTILTNFVAVGDGYIDTTRFENLGQDLSHFILLKEENRVLLSTLDEVRQDTYEQIHGNMAEGSMYLEQEDAMVLHTKMQAELKQAVYQLNQLESLQEKIDLTHEDYTLYNLYILPLKNLVISSDVQEMAWFCLGFAILIDGLTLMFALTQGKERNLLFVSNNRQITRRTKDGMEELLLTTIMDHYAEDNQDSVIESVRKHLRSFLKPFKLMPEGVQDGYSMICTLDRLEEYNIFVAALCQFNLAVIVNGEELWWLENADRVAKKKYILLKTKFVIWAKQKIADLAFKEEYLDAVKEVNEAREVKIQMATHQVVELGGEQL